MQIPHTPKLLKVAQMDKKEPVFCLQRETFWRLLTGKLQRKIPLALFLPLLALLQQGGWEASRPQEGNLAMLCPGSKTTGTWGKGSRCRVPGTYSSRTFIFSPFLKDKSSGWMPS